MTKLVDSIHPELLEALRERGHSDGVIAKMTPALAFREFCEWHGLHNWSSTLMSVYESAKNDFPTRSAS